MTHRHTSPKRYSFGCTTCGAQLYLHAFPSQTSCYSCGAVYQTAYDNRCAITTTPFELEFDPLSDQPYPLTTVTEDYLAAPCPACKNLLKFAAHPSSTVCAACGLQAVTTYPCHFTVTRPPRTDLPDE